MPGWREKPASSPALSGVLVLVLWADGWGPGTQAGPNVVFGVAPAAASSSGAHQMYIGTLDSRLYYRLR